jgi:hypothetical protein
MGTVFPMAPLSERQRKAQALTTELQKINGGLSAWVVNPMPLSDEARGLRCQILNWPSSNYQEVLQTLREWGYQPAVVGSGLRFCTDGTARGCDNVEIPIPHERQPVADDRTIPRSEIEEKRSTPTEVELVKRHLGIK